MLKSISKTLLTGFITLLPVVLTLYLLYWLAVSTESVLGRLIQLMLPDHLYWPGMGVIAGLAVIFAVGLLMHTYVVQRVFARGEHGQVVHIDRRHPQRIVLVDVPGEFGELLTLLLRRDRDDANVG